MSDLLTLSEVAASLRVSVRTLEREAQDGRLAIMRIRSKRLVAPEELERYKLAAQCQSEKSATVGKSVSASVVESALNALSRQLQPETTRGHSKLRSGARRSTLRLVEIR